MLNPDINIHKKKSGIVQLVTDKKKKQLFENIVYLIDDALPVAQQQELKNMLNSNGGTLGNLENNIPNLYISMNNCSLQQIKTVSPFWVKNAIIRGIVQKKHDRKKQFLSGEIILLSDLPESRKRTIFKEINRYGGEYSNEITKNITCLVCTSASGETYNECIKRNIPVVLPQWLDDCFRFQQKFDYKPYRLPSPYVYYFQNPRPARLFSYPTDTNSLNSILPQGIDDREPIFKNHFIYFGQDVMADQRKLYMMPIITSYIERLGGRVMNDYNSDLTTIVILKYRSSEEYIQAAKDGKCIASFWWISNTLARGYLCSPLSVLLDYPIPKIGIPGMIDCVIAITGYKGAQRTFLNALVIASGAKLSTSLCNGTTHLICASHCASKYADLNKFPAIILVNHIWLEECYTNWKKIDYKSDRRYSYIPQNNKSLDHLVARTCLMPHILKQREREVLNGEPKITYQEFKKKTGKTALRLAKKFNNFNTYKA
ncbi:BRCT domain-containing protein [Cokeromyces recurvatus]|uniref:BRCT domain-containing protein n=1 Tax=Cokeromyces recurvatus TaxID=90255 RepID=UPI00221EDED0|nr:BRCT domain-containing protein [Cokeromyces recurvatus]XP_051381272.1 BRCT domain-containing protein [Cokeromyces recurvatus]KAI7898949.1 BRCT domain-containing protein [Cokeromyces recurvatus]KAI7901287.1 BRCT domain-containing protein [Cokeromyces recurvatus]